MKVLILSSGLGTSYRGYERFVLDMAEQLRALNCQVNCWGSADAPGIHGLPFLGREELERLALEKFRQHPDHTFHSFPELHDWAQHTEDQLFGISAMARLTEEIRLNPPDVVYVKWQGGLMDAGGKSTGLLELLARESLAGRIRTVIHADWAYPSAIERLNSAKFTFHSITPWITRRLRALGVRPGSILELPMATMCTPFQGLERHRKQLRQEAGIPDDAFAALTVGAFDNEVKNFPYLVQELAPLAGDEKFYWIAAGARGPEPPAWEKEARALFGRRFISQVGVPFERMPDVYALGDLSLCGSLDETFGLCYLESHFAGLPCLMHDYMVTRWITEDLPSELASISRIDMRGDGNALAAVEQWRGLLTSPHRRAAAAEILDDFRRGQEKRFSWEHLGSQFAEAFERTAHPQAAGAQGVFA
jgi:glycosyltransferase involved in cell wall biosynthesis